MCKVLKVSRSSYYKFLNKTESKRTIENKGFEERILSIYEESKKRYSPEEISQKFVIMTAYNSPQVLSRANSYQCKLLNKPFDNLEEALRLMTE